MATLPVRLEAWFRDQLPELNRAVLGGAPRTAVADAMSTLLPGLPAPGSVSIPAAQRMIIGLGLAGSSVARHYQEEYPARRRHPERAFDGLAAGPEMIPFREYFAALADRTGTGHYGRDAYASLVLWNVPTTEVYYAGEPLATLPGVTGADEPILSYTGDPAEQWFFELVKRGQTLERGVNTLLAPVADADLDPAGPDARERVRKATTVLEALRRLFLRFADVRPGVGMQPHYFMDVFRQYAAHWVADDIPPSGALDVDALQRDFLFGTVDEHYARHIRRILPALLTEERAELTRRMERPSLPDRLLATLGLDRVTLAQLSPDRLEALAGAHPEVGEWHRLLTGHARAAGAHLMLSKRFLFNPQRRRDDEGIGDTGIVSNRRGTTGMDESILDRLTRMRREHALAAVRPAAGQPPAPLNVGDVDLRPAPLVRFDKPEPEVATRAAGGSRR